MIKVFYDGKCGLCSKEINHYRKIAPDGIFDWQDITVNAELLNSQGVTLSEGLKYLHVQDSSGSMHIGVDAFILIWKQLARWKWLAWIVSLPIIKVLASFLYKCFANWRFNRLPHCKISMET